MAKRRGKGEGGTIVIKREEIIAGGHHGGAWKVAYADFVTAMMAFFLLMWLLNATTEQQRRGIAAYFSPMATVENGFSGSGLIPGGVTPLDKGTDLVIRTTTSPVALVVPASAKPSPPDINSGGTGDADDTSAPPRKLAAAALLDGGDAAPAPPRQSVNYAGDDGSAAPPTPHTEADRADSAAGGPEAEAGHGDAAAQEQRSLTAAAASLTRVVASDPALAGSAGQMAIDVTPEGLRIQIMDRDSKPMFDRGAATLNERAAALLRKVAPFLAGLPEPVSIDGYTDAAAWPAGSVSNWSLSSGRANSARDLLVGSGLPDSRITDVTGYADRHLLLPAQPMADANRRVVLTLRRLQAPPTALAPAPAPMPAPVPVPVPALAPMPAAVSTSASSPASASMPTTSANVPAGG